MIPATHWSGNFEMAVCVGIRFVSRGTTASLFGIKTQGAWRIKYQSLFPGIQRWHQERVSLLSFVNNMQGNIVCSILKYNMNYYMPSSASGHDERNRALWLATRAGKMERSCPLGTTRCIPQAKFPKSHIINPLLTKFVRSRWLDIDLVHFLRLYGPRLHLGQ